MTTQQKSLPKTMKACVATGFGGIDDNVFLRHDWPTPVLEEEGTMLVKVLACALAPGDVRVLSGKTAMMQLPEGPPWVPGSDVAATVVATHTTETKFQQGDYVVCRFDEPKPRGGLAEYRVVKTYLSEKCPLSISPNVACGLTASAMAAKRIVQLEGFVHPGDHVLIIGGSGAVGSSMIQYAKLVKDTNVIAVSAQTEMCQKLGADQVIDYRTRNWWEVTEFQTNKFDVVIDLVNGNNWTIGACSQKAIKPSGQYIALLSGVEMEIEARGTWDIVKIMSQFLGRVFYSRLHPRVPKWLTPEALKLEDGNLKSLLQDVVDGNIQPQIDSIHEFTEKGVRQAFARQKSKHAHGKVVVTIARQA